MPQGYLADNCDPVSGQPRRAADEADVVSTPSGEFCRATEQGGFPSPVDGDGVW